MFLTDKASLGECKDSESAKSLIIGFLDFFMYEKEAWLRDCPVPCTQRTHHLTVSTFHQNSIFDQKWVESFKNESLVFYINYDSFTIQKSVEKLRYDLVDLFTQAGGNLGLFLGCSCLSILISAIELLRSINCRI